MVGTRKMAMAGVAVTNGEWWASSRTFPPHHLRESHVVMLPRRRPGTEQPQGATNSHERIGWREPKHRSDLDAIQLEALDGELATCHCLAPQSWACVFHMQSGGHRPRRHVGNCRAALVRPNAHTQRVRLNHSV